MGTVADQFNLAFRDFNTDGVPSSGDYEVVKGLVRYIGPLIEQLLAVSGVATTIFPDNASGIAGTTNGQLFLVQGSGDTFAYLYKHDNTQTDPAVPQNIEIPSTAFVSSRLAKTGDEMTGSLFMNGHNIGGVGDPSGDYDAIARAYALRTIAIFSQIWVTRRGIEPYNLFDSGASTANTALDGSTGTYFSASGYSVTGKTAIRGSDPVRVSIPIHQYAFYDANQIYISGYSSGTYLDAASPIAVPTGAAFFETDASTSDIPNLQITQRPTIPLLHRNPFNRSRWHNKVIGFLGDSQWMRITSSANAGFFQAAVTEDLGAVDFPFTNDCVSGRTWADCLPGGSSPALTSDAIVPLDMLCILLGANDWDASRPLGAYSDASSADSMVGNIRKAFELLYGFNPHLRVVVFLPNKRGANPAVVPSLKSYKQPNSLGLVLEDYVNMIAKVAADYGAQTIDLFRDMPFTDATFNYYSGGGDWIHLDHATGQPMMADFATARLRAV